MTKKHFIALARALRASRPSFYYPRPLFSAVAREQWELDRDAVADFCASVNPRFDRARWLDYVDGEPTDYHYDLMDGCDIWREVRKQRLRAAKGGVR